MSIKKAISHFRDFHKGSINQVLHVIGFAGLFYGIYKMNWLLIVMFLFVLESGHVYNHFAGIKKYDLRPAVIFWRTLIFLAVAVGFYLLSK